MFKFHLLFCWVEGRNPTNVLHDFVGFLLSIGYVPKSTFINFKKILTMKLYCSPPNNSDGIFPHRSPFVLRSFSVHPPLILRSSSVPSPFNLRSGIEERTENDRRIIGGKTEMYRLHIGIETNG